MARPPNASALPNLAEICKEMLCVVGVVVAILMVSLGILGIYLVGFNKESEMPNFQFDSASFTLLDNAIGPNITAKLNVAFIVENPNKNYNISFYPSVVTLDYGGRCKSLPDYYDHCTGLLGSSRFPTFLQLSRSKKVLPFQINVIDQFVGDSIVTDRAKGSIEFGLKLIARFTGISTCDCVDYCAEFYCKHMSFAFKSNNATFASGTCLSLPLFEHFPVYKLKN